MSNKYLQGLRDYVGGQRLTLSGEIIICSKQNTQLLQITADESKTVDKILNALQQQFPFLKLEKKTNVVEITVKLFAYKKFMADEQFLEHLRGALAAAVKSINESETLTARVTANGLLLNSNLQQKFVFLSKASMVEYKVTETISVTGLSEVTMHRLQVYSIAIVFTALIIYNLYVLYAYIPDHNPNRLLTKIVNI